MMECLQNCMPRLITFLDPSTSTSADASKQPEHGELSLKNPAIHPYFHRSDSTPAIREHGQGERSRQLQTWRNRRVKPPNTNVGG